MSFELKTPMPLEIARRVTSKSLKLCVGWVWTGMRELMLAALMSLIGNHNVATFIKT